MINRFYSFNIKEGLDKKVAYLYLFCLKISLFICILNSNYKTRGLINFDGSMNSYALYYREKTKVEQIYV